MNTIFLYLSYTIAYTGGLGLLIFFIMIIPLWLITGRYYDNQLGFKKIFNPAADASIGPSFMMRTMQYATCIFFKKAFKKSYNRMVFGDVNFREKARRVDVILSSIFTVTVIGSFVVGMIFALIYIGLKIISIVINLF